MKLQRKTATRSTFKASRICIFIPGELPQDRHRRRYELALPGEPIVRAWCEYRGVEFRLTDIVGMPKFKWRFSAPDKFAIWMPFVGKLSLKRSLHGEYHVIKVHDYEQLLKALEWWIL